MTAHIKTLIRNLNIVFGCPDGCELCYARNSCGYYHTSGENPQPVFHERKLELMRTSEPTNFLLNGMSDLAYWKQPWRSKVFSYMRENPWNTYVFLTKRPDLLQFSTDLDCAWIGVSVCDRESLGRIGTLRRNVDARHYHVTFDPLIEDVGTVDLSGIEWVVIGAEPGRRNACFHPEPSWTMSICDQAHDAGIPMFMNESLNGIVDERELVRELPKGFAQANPE